MGKLYNLTTSIIAVLLAFFSVGCGESGGIMLKQVAHNPAETQSSKPEGIDIFIDASGSMKGYIDGVQGNFKTNVPDLITNPKNVNSLSITPENIKCYTINNMQLVSHDSDKFRQSISNSSIFNGQSTELHQMFKLVARKIIEAPTHVGIIVSDCVLSFPSNVVRSNREANIQNVGILENNVTDAMTDLVNNGLSVAIVKYESDFNGNYYYTYQNRVLAVARGQVMHNRPYYFIMMGTKENIDAMFSKKVLADGYTDIYAYNTQCARPSYRVIRAKKCGSISEIYDNVPDVMVNQKGGKESYFYLAVEDFPVSSYVESTLAQTMENPRWKGTLIKSCEAVNFGDIQSDCNIYPMRSQIKGKTPDKSDVLCSYLYKVTLKSNEDLKNIPNSVPDVIYFPNRMMDTDTCKSAISNDLVEKIEDLENRTFMFDRLISGINKAYIGFDPHIASLEININKKTNN